MRQKMNRMKLALNRETLHSLQDAQLGQVAGGGISQAGCASKPPVCGTSDRCPTADACPRQPPPGSSLCSGKTYCL